MMAILTLRDLQNFDHAPQRSGLRTRYLCVFCHADKPSDNAHRCLDVDEVQGVYVCHRCRAKGRLGREVIAGDRNHVTRRTEDVQAHAARQAEQWRKVKATLRPLKGTAGASYLEKRGIPEAIATQCGVLFSNNFLGRAAVVFPARDYHEKICAMQGRYTTNAEPKTRTLGKAKLGAFWTVGAWDDEVTLCEAPIDALSLLALGIPACAMLGCGNLPYWLPQATKGHLVNIATDADEAGDKAAMEWSQALYGIAANVKRLRPCVGKDWNDELLQGKQ